MPQVCRRQIPSSCLASSETRHLVGLGVLFGKLQQGVVENRQVLIIARLRAEAEETYGQRLQEIAPAADKLTGGFARDDGATVRKVGPPPSPPPFWCLNKPPAC